MRGSKAGLADLKQLHEKAQAARKDSETRAQATRAADNASTQQHPEVLTQDARQLFARATLAVEPIQSKARVRHGHTENLNLHHAVTSTRQSDMAQLLEQKRRRATGQADDRHNSLASHSQAKISDVYAPIKDSDSDVTWASPGIGPDTLRKLRQAYWPVGAQLDLHGMSSEQARSALLMFVQRSLEHGTRCIRVIHGQGFGSVNGHAVLKNLVKQWLTQIPGVTCFVSAPQAHGGRGALLVLIRQR
jgi:DNA-nicking Smr family endonuclease